MDATEYEEMKKNAQLLQEAKENQEKLSEQIIALKNEKIDALNKAKDQVLMIKRSIRKEEVVMDWDSRSKAMDIVRHIMSRAQQRYSGPAGIDEYYLATLAQQIYKIQTTEVVNDEIIEFIGLEQAKAEVQKEYEQRMGRDTKRKLKRAETLMSENGDLAMKNEQLKRDLAACSAANEKLLKQQSEFGNIYQENDDNYELLQDVQSILSQRWTVLNFGSKLKMLNAVIKDLGKKMPNPFKNES